MVRWWPGRVVDVINPFTVDPVKAVHFAILVWPTILNVWHSGALALSSGRQSARVSKNYSGGLHQYGAEPFERQQFGPAGVEGVKFREHNLLSVKSCSVQARTEEHKVAESSSAV